MTPEEEKFNRYVLRVLKKIKDRELYTKKGELIEYQVKFYGYKDPTLPPPENEIEILEKLQEWGAIQIRNKEDIGVSSSSPEGQIFYLEIIPSKFNETCKEREKLTENYYKQDKNLEESSTKETENPPPFFEIKVIDREIWVNNFLLSKPHGVGTNFETFDAIRRKKANTPIKKTDLQNWLQEKIGSGSLTDILYQLGFTGEILKAFFPKRSKKGIIEYSGDKITKKNLEERGIKISVFLKELELAHLKNHPE